MNGEASGLALSKSHSSLRFAFFSSLLVNNIVIVN